MTQKPGQPESNSMPELSQAERRLVISGSLGRQTDVQRKRILMRLKFVMVPGVLGSVSAQSLRRKEARLAKKSGEQPNEPRGSVSPVAAA